ncbi:hypothetical protein BP5796_13032 [Coleophoma crateriformis]|uniref:Major facilitator superfamily (MFS) profile domain-containing protein n=1 Tax=Coleophoma crateriformis TaxID=565419 RepID=A0A3D8Q547_9HELO|nr:hypothetical protein BP5796_13032 [Coleophoma crateriformis]
MAEHHELHNGISQNPRAVDDGTAPPEIGPPAQKQEHHAPTNIETAQTAPASTEGDFSIYSDKQKRWIIVAASFAGFFSPLSSSIYFPALSTIARNLNVTNAKVNLTVTTFLIIQGLAPMMTAGFSDSAGRRPAYMICFVLYLAANLGLALQNSYPALLVLRCLQSTGSSGTIALASGVVSDLVTSSERGKYIAFATIGTILGPTVAPLLGGIITQFLDWHWLFWFLLILSGSFCVPFLLFMPETCRNIVGDGSIDPPALNRSLVNVLMHRKALKSEAITTSAQKSKKGHVKFRVPNPLSTLVVFWDIPTALILLVAGLSSGAFNAVMTGASEEFRGTYHFNNIKIALMFIPLGVGGVLSAFTTGRVVDWNYRRHAKRCNMPIIRNKRQDLTNFPIERARLEFAIPMLFLGAASVIIYGWIMQSGVNVSGPIIVIFIMGYTISAAYQTLNVLLVDIYPGKGATVTAANNLLRCETGAAAAAVIAPMISSIGTGWSYTIMGLISVMGVPGLMLNIRYGMRWRQAKARKKAAAAVSNGTQMTEQPAN